MNIPMMKMKTYKTNFDMVLHKLFGMTTLVLIGGIWRTGKTDFSLYLSEELLKRNIVSEVATNIFTFGHYKQISDIKTIEYWLHRNKRRKLYILDEANKHLPSRRSMSNKSVQAVQVLSELSKGKGRLIVIAQNLKKIDAEYKEETWLRGVFKKLNKKTVILNSRLLPQEYMFTKLPRTKIKFDKDVTAPLTVSPPKEELFKDEDLRKLYEWANGATWKTLFNHPQACNRFVRKQVKRLLDKYSPIHT